MYPDVLLLIDGAWTKSSSGRSLPVVNPASGETNGTVAHAGRADLDRALEAADKGFRVWRKISAYDRSKLMRKAAELLRERADAVARLMTLRTRQAARRSQGRNARRRRRDRLVRGRSPPRLWPRGARPRRRHLPAGAERAGRPGRGVYAVELPDQPGGAQAVRGTRRRLLDHRQGAGGDPRLPGRADPLLRRCRRAGRAW